MATTFQQLKQRFGVHQLVHTPNDPTNKGFKKENHKNQKGSSTVHSNSKEEEDGILRMCCDGQKYSQ